MKIILIASLMISSLITGCASSKHYPNNYYKNVTINLKMNKSNSFLNSIEASAGVNDLKKDCTTQYKGFINLSVGNNKLGLANGKLTW